MCVDITSDRLRELYAYWEARCSGRPAPRRSDIDPVDVPQLLPLMAICEVLQAPRSYVVRLFGTGLVEMLGRDLTGKAIHDILHGAHLDSALADLDRVTRSMRPVCTIRDGAWIGKGHLRYERLLLPLSEDGVTVDRLLAGAVPLR